MRGVVEVEQFQGGALQDFWRQFRPLASSQPLGLLALVALNLSDSQNKKSKPYSLREIKKSMVSVAIVVGLAPTFAL